MKRPQLEISFGNKPVCGRQRGRQGRRTKARWWFGQMRRVVEETLEWRPVAGAAPVQPFLPLTNAGGK